MKSKYKEIFKKLIEAYESGSFDSTIDVIIQVYDVNKIELCNIISSLCGVHVNYSLNYVSDLKHAIESYSGNQKIVEKVISCNIDCNPVDKVGLCQRSCPFDAIINDGKTTKINPLKCVDCGLCIDACPKGNILDKIQYIPLVKLLKSDKPVIAAVAPAIVGQFGSSVSLDHLRSAFISLGFQDMIEVAFFADLLTMKEAVEFHEHIHTKNDLLITSCCCPMWVAMIKRLYSDLSKYVTPSISPMIAAGRILKELNPNYSVVFIGPCVAKKAEAQASDISDAIDFVLTFTELKDIFDTIGVIPSKLTPLSSESYASKCGRTYGYTGGVSDSVASILEYIFPEKYSMYSPFQADGVKACKEILNTSLSQNTLPYNFIEGMGCVGGCVGGPKVLIDPLDGESSLRKLGDESEILVPNESPFATSILQKLNIYSINDMKNKTLTKIFHRDL